MPLLVFLQAAIPGSAGNFATGFLPILLMIGIFYFLVFMPMRRQQKKQKDMIGALEPGNVVLTSGGIVGTVLAVNGDTLILRIKPDNVKLEVARSAVTSLVGGPGATPPAKS